MALEQRELVGDTAGVRWCILSLVTSKLWRSLKLKLVRSLPRPFSLQSFQLSAQSVAGEDVSALHGLYCLVLVSSIMVRFSSVKSWVQSLMDMVLTLPGVLWWTFLMVSKNAGG